MSAIFGIINKNGAPVEDEMIEKMRSSILHRAVDGSGIVKSGNMMFGHHKLTVHSRQAQEKQPLQIDDLVITCDARIDNIEELFVELQIEMTTENFTDPYIILQAYKKWGNDCAKHLEGEFCFAIWNESDEEFFGGSDYIGTKTFYYYENQFFFAFATLIKTIETIKTEKTILNEEVFFNYFNFSPRFVTYDKKIYILSSANWLKLDKFVNLTTGKYWLAKKRNFFSFKDSYDWSKCLLEIVTKTIKNQIKSEYPVGILLSGGLDSSFVAAVACKLLSKENRTLHAFCCVLSENYSGRKKDERDFIEKLKEAYDNLEIHYVIVPDCKGPYADVRNALNYSESIVDIVHYAEYEVFKCAESLNVRVLLSGIGGDESISYKGHGIIFNYFKKGNFLTAFELFLKKYKIENNSFKNQVRMDFLTHIPFLWRIIEYFKNENNISVIPVKKNTRDKINVNTWLNFKTAFKNELNGGEIGSRIYGITKFANAFNLQLCHPLMSKQTSQFFLDIPEKELLLDGRKRSLIKNTMKNLVPEEIIDRTDKLPFSPDFGERILKIDLKCLNKLISHQSEIEKATDISFEKLFELIQKAKNSNALDQMQFKNDFFYIPITIIAVEFYLWIKDKQAEIANN